MKMKSEKISKFIFIVKRKSNVPFRGGSRINFQVLQNFTKKIENRNDITIQKNYRFSKKQEARRYDFDYSRGADLKVKFDSSKKHPPYGG